MQSELKPCPFCGHSAHIEQRGDRSMSTIYQCDNCGCSLETGEEFNHGAGWNNRAALEAALSAAEPVAWQPRYKQEVIDHHKSIGSDLWEYAMTVYPTKEQAQSYGYGGHECRALYAEPQPAPSVSVKALEWKAHNEGFGHGRMYYGTGVFGHWYGVSRVKTGCWACVHHVDGKPVHMPMAKSLDLAKAAAQADYEARVRSALSAQVQDVEEQRTETCQRCQGNGEIVTDWERYRHPHENDVGDEAVAECPDCDGIGKVSAQVQDVAGWQLVPKEPTQEMLDAFRLAETKKRFDIMSAHPTEEPEAGGGTIGYGYRAMLAAAPAKQEG